jgi:hypothetical protein
VQSAADHPQTRAALAGHLAGALRWLGGGVIAVVLGVLIGIAAVAIAGNTGQRVPIAGPVVLVLVLVGAAATVAGLGALIRTLRWRRALAGTAWRIGRLRIAGPAIIAFEPEGYDELDPDDDRLHLRLLSTAVWRTRAIQGLNGLEVWVAPVGGRQWVITADGLPTLYGARAVRPGR